MEIKDEFGRKGIVDKLKAKGEYKVKDGYEMLKERKEKVKWAQQVWYCSNLPKHAFISWLAMRGRLQTKE